MRSRRPNGWVTIGVPLATVLFTAGAAILGSYVGAAAQNRAQDVRMVEIALSILKGESKDEKGKPARQFAIETLKRYSGLNAEVDWSAWLNGGTVPFEDLSLWTRVLDKYRISDLLTGTPSSERAPNQ